MCVCVYWIAKPFAERTRAGRILPTRVKLAPFFGKPCQIHSHTAECFVIALRLGQHTGLLEGRQGLLDTP
jgi:hypothetical protein